MFNKCYYFILIFIFTGILNYGQFYQGPATGNVSSGDTVSTDNFLRAVSIGEPQIKGRHNVITPPYKHEYFEFNKPSLSGNYFEDPNIKGEIKDSITILLKDFPGIGVLNFIPPDPHIAVGPTHIIATINSQFGIWDKEGNLISVTDANNWHNGIVPNPGSPGIFDPQIMYDHFDKRWFMVWDHVNDATQTANFLISVSDDSIPLGIWYTWAIPSNTNGNTVVNNWSDFPGIGYDKDAFYINGRQFTFGDPAQLLYNKIRIISKAEIYSSNGGALSWKDIWDISYPHNANKPDVIKPTIVFGSPSEYFLLHANRGGANFISLYRITNPLTNPVLSGINVSIPTYGFAPDANQLGGGNPLIDVRGSNFKTAPVYRDGYLWAVHNVQNSSFPQYSGITYYKINVSNNSLVETATMGAQGFWYIYPTIMVDKDQNVAIGYSRSGINEYVGAYYTTRLVADPPGLSGSHPLQTGKGNYVVTFSGDRNRWGDYMGISLDPSDENNIWIFTEYAAANNRYGTWVGEIRLIPFPGIFGHMPISELNFGEIETNFISDTLTAVLFNYGTDNLIISSIPDSVGPFHLISDISFPLNLASYDSLKINVVFAPKDTGFFDMTLPITINDPSISGLRLTGNSYEINTAVEDVIYASSGAFNDGGILTINHLSGISTPIGLSFFDELKSITINPLTNVIYGINTSLTETKIVRINATLGDAHMLYNIPLGEAAGIAFDTLGTLYAATEKGNIYIINLDDGTYNLISTTSVHPSGIAINPLTNELWASVLVVVGTNKDRVYKIDINTGADTLIGKTGFNIVTNDIVFDKFGNLYGITGSSNQVSKFINIDTATAAGTLIGEVGVMNVTGLAYLPGEITSVRNDGQNEQLPNEFSLNQNYPNPFNPSTTIEFALPYDADIKLVVYNLIGEVIDVLKDGSIRAGYHRVIWNSKDNRGKQLSSGIYFYELKASATDGTDFTQIKKMILLK